jgi:hypothetical protein
MGNAAKHTAATHLTSVSTTTASATQLAAARAPAASTPLEPQPSLPTPRNEPCRGARGVAGKGRGCAAPPESSEAKPDASRVGVVGGRTSGFTFLFLTPPRAPQPPGPGCLVSHRACGLVGKVEGGDVSGNSCLRSGRRRRASELLGLEPASLAGEWRVWIPGRERGQAGWLGGFEVPARQLGPRRVFAPSR